MSDLILLYWVLPSLLSALYWINLVRREDKMTPSEYESTDWVGLFLLSALYPIAILNILWDRGLLKLFEFITKERKW